MVTILILVHKFNTSLTILSVNIKYKTHFSIFLFYYFNINILLNINTNMHKTLKRGSVKLSGSRSSRSSRRSGFRSSSSKSRTLKGGSLKVVPDTVKPVTFAISTKYENHKYQSDNHRITSLRMLNNGIKSSKIGLEGKLNTLNSNKNSNTIRQIEGRIKYKKAKYQKATHANQLLAKSLYNQNPLFSQKQLNSLPNLYEKQNDFKQAMIKLHTSKQSIQNDKTEPQANQNFVKQLNSFNNPEDIKQIFKDTSLLRSEYFKYRPKFDIYKNENTQPVNTYVEAITLFKRSNPEKADEIEKIQIFKKYPQLLVYAVNKEIQDSKKKYGKNPDVNRN